MGHKFMWKCKRLWMKYNFYMDRIKIDNFFEHSINYSVAKVLQFILIVMNNIIQRGNMPQND